MLRRSEEAPSRPVDLAQVNEKLLKVTANTELGCEQSAKSPLASTASTVTIDEEQEHLKRLQEETEAYHTLINDGGRPSHPLSLLESIGEDPGEYHEILSFWQADHHNDWKVFTKQLERWESFRQLQKYSRGLHVHEYERERQWARDSGRYDDWDLDEIVFPFGQYRRWDCFIGRPQSTANETRFPAYTDAVKK